MRQRSEGLQASGFRISLDTADSRERDARRKSTMPLEVRRSVACLTLE
jgi:hypothetical protein